MLEWLCSARSCRAHVELCRLELPPDLGIRLMALQGMQLRNTVTAVWFTRYHHFTILNTTWGHMGITSQHQRVSVLPSSLAVRQRRATRGAGADAVICAVRRADCGLLLT